MGFAQKHQRQESYYSIDRNPLIALTQFEQASPLCFIFYSAGEYRRDTDVPQPGFASGNAVNASDMKRRCFSVTFKKHTQLSTLIIVKCHRAQDRYLRVILGQ